MKVVQKNIAEITPYENNPRQNDDAVGAVAESIRQFGFRQPIVVDEQGVIVCGHTRYKAAQMLELKRVPVHVATDLMPEQIRAYRIADNKTGELTTWDMDLLPIKITELQDAGIDWSLLGFDEDDLARLMAGEESVSAGLTDPDDVPNQPSVGPDYPRYERAYNERLAGESFADTRIGSLHGAGVRQRGVPHIRLI